MNVYKTKTISVLILCCALLSSCQKDKDNEIKFTSIEMNTLIHHADGATVLVWGKTASEIIKKLPFEPTYIGTSEEPDGYVGGIMVVGYYENKKVNLIFSLDKKHSLYEHKLENLLQYKVMDVRSF